VIGNKNLSPHLQWL